jgi:hypothetical protein
MIASCFPPYSLFFPKLRSPSIPSLFLLAILILHCTAPCSSILGEFAEMNQEGNESRGKSMTKLRTEFATSIIKESNIRKRKRHKIILYWFLSQHESSPVTLHLKELRHTSKRLLKLLKSSDKRLLNAQVQRRETSQCSSTYIGKKLIMLKSYDNGLLTI